MTSKLDMSLDKIIANQPRANRGGRPSRGARTSGPIRRSGGSSFSNGGNGGGNGGGSQRNQLRTAPYARPVASAFQSLPLQPFSFPVASSGGGGGGGAEAQWKHDKFQPAPQPTKKIEGDTVFISNLASDITDGDVREIFQNVGTIKTVAVNYNSSGESLGTAQVTFSRASDAQKAVDEYNDAEVDGRTMKLKLVGSVVQAPVIVKKQRPTVMPHQQHQQQQLQQLPVLPVGAQLFQTFTQPQLFNQPQQRQNFRQQRQVVTNQRGGRRGGAPQQQQRGGGGGGGRQAQGSSRGRGGAARGGRGGGRTNGNKKEASAADLDAEMDSYMSSNSGAEKQVDLAAAGQPTL